MAIFNAKAVRATLNVANKTAELAYATKAVATETAELAKATQALAKETITANILADRHHQESLTPCVVLSSGFIDRQRDALVLRDVSVTNIGTGPAFDLRVWIGELADPIQVGGVAAGGTLINVQARVTILDQIIRPMPIRLVLLYRNLFGTIGKTTHFGNVGDASFTTVIEPPPISSRVPNA